MSAPLHRRRFLGGLAAASLAASGAVRASDFPQRPITLVLPYAPGGSADVLGRVPGAGNAARSGPERGHRLQTRCRRQHWCRVGCPPGARRRLQPALRRQQPGQQREPEQAELRSAQGPASGGRPGRHPQSDGGVGGFAVPHGGRRAEGSARQARRRHLRLLRPRHRQPPGRRAVCRPGRRDADARALPRQRRRVSRPDRPAHRSAVRCGRLFRGAGQGRPRPCTGHHRREPLAGLPRSADAGRERPARLRVRDLVRTVRPERGARRRARPGSSAPRWRRSSPRRSTSSC